ncbi:MAG: hypothetical protein Q7S79_01080 [bacterium]|nr:hypothetical protein [bacterium]
MTTKERPVGIDLAIGEPRWRPDDFLRQNRAVRLPDKIDILLRPVQVQDYTPQLDQSSFEEFDEDGSPYSAELMRTDGCGVCSVHMANVTLGGDNYRGIFPTVGFLAKSALKFHEDDPKDVAGNRLRKGTPVYSKKDGWYHDGLLYTTWEYTGLNVFRQEGLESWEQVAQECLEETRLRESILAVVSVNNVHWRRPGETPSKEQHLVVITGFKIRAARVTAIRVTDPYVDPNPDAPRNKINEWLPVNDNIRTAFRGRAMYFWK